MKHERRARSRRKDRRGFNERAREIEAKSRRIYVCTRCRQECPRGRSVGRVIKKFGRYAEVAFLIWMKAVFGSVR